MSQIPFEVGRSLTGAKQVKYACPQCKGDLSSPLSDVGKTDQCPICSATFTVPGRQLIEAEKQRRQRRAQPQPAQPRSEPVAVRQPVKAPNYGFLGLCAWVATGIGVLFALLGMLLVIGGVIAAFRVDLATGAIGAGAGFAVLAYAIPVAGIGQFLQAFRDMARNSFAGLDRAV